MDPNSDQQVQSNNQGDDATNQSPTVTNDQALTNLNTSTNANDVFEPNMDQNDTSMSDINNQANPISDGSVATNDVPNTDSNAAVGLDTPQNDFVTPGSAVLDTQPVEEYQPPQPQGIPTVTEPTMVSTNLPTDQPKWEPEQQDASAPPVDNQDVVEDNATLDVQNDTVPPIPPQPYSPEPAQTQPDNAEQQPMQPLSDEQPAAKENIYTEICSQIIREQEKIIGALAIEQADQVDGLAVNPVTYHCIVTGDGSKVINDLIEQYRDFFGHAAVEVCKEAASKFLTKLPANETPELLR